MIFGMLKISQSLSVEVLLSDRAISTIVGNVAKIVTVPALKQELEKAHIRVDCTLLSKGGVLQSLFAIIDRCMTEAPPLNGRADTVNESTRKSLSASED
jgi:hypothetical protein